MNRDTYKLGIDIGSTTVKVAVLDPDDQLVFSDYQRHFANIQETLSSLLSKAHEVTGDIMIAPMITGSGGLTLAKHLGVSFVQEVIAVSTALTHYAPQTDVAIEPVSYTHLSVRRSRICAGQWGRFPVSRFRVHTLCRFPVRAQDLRSSRYGMPVSGASPSATPAGNPGSVSYTHLDVYKRQVNSCLISSSW